MIYEVHEVTLEGGNIGMQLAASPESLAVDEAVYRRLPTAASRVRAWVRSCGICGRQ
jgi:hypothetical protein